MAVSSSTILRGVKEYLLITLGIVIYTVGWAIFLTPNNLIGGGVSGISANYGDAEKYLTFAHDEFTMKPTLDADGRLVPRLHQVCQWYSSRW